MSFFPAFLIPLVALIYIAVIVYVLMLVTRLVKAVERIADKLDSTKQ
jgi:hypothetical protein